MIAHRLRLTAAAAAFAVMTVGSIAVAQAPVMNGPAQVATTPLGMILTGPNGMTLYSFDRDVEDNVSACYGQCAINWPPFYAEDGAVSEGDWMVIPRTDDRSMWSYKGMPLYYYINDTAPGMTSGDNPAGVWHVVVVPAM